MTSFSFQYEQTDIPAGMKMREYRASRPPVPTRWEKVRVILLGTSGILGILMALFTSTQMDR